MNPDWIMGLIGGLMIGGAAALLLLGTGRIMGASGILGGVVDGSAGKSYGERIVFLAALIGVPGLMVALGIAERSAPVANWAGLLIAGLLVGFGTRLANGCTSGHGVCGISRLSLRGIMATVTYLGFGVLGVVLGRAMGWGL